MSVKVLIADDEIKANKIVQKNYKQQIADANIVEFVGDGEEALKIIKVNESSLDLIIVDLKMSPMGGIELINLLTTQRTPIKIIVISAYASGEEIKNHFQKNKNVLGFLEKPFDINRLNKIIQENFSVGSSSNLFDYSQFDAETSLFVREQTEEIRGLIKRTAQGISDIGQKLLEIKEKLGHGNFLNWLKTEFNWSEPSAQRFMQVARQFKSTDLMDLEIAPSALYILSAPSTPDSVRQEAVSRAKAGENITYTTAKEIKHQYQTAIAEKEQKKSDARVFVADATVDRSKVEVDRLNEEELKPSPEQKIIAVVPRQITDEEQTVVRADSWYQLGQKHLLYCGKPDSSQFKKRLPKKIALSIAFPPTSNWQPTNLEANSELSFYSRYQDLDTVTFKEMIQCAFELYTEDRESVVFSYLPEPQLLILAHQLGCRCFIAEPETEKCEAIIGAWKKNWFTTNS